MNVWEDDRHGFVDVKVDRVRNAGQELHHLHLCQVPLPRAADFQGRHEIVTVHQHVNERVAEGSEVAVAAAVNLGGPRKRRVQSEKKKEVVSGGLKRGLGLALSGSLPPLPCRPSTTPKLS